MNKKIITSVLLVILAIGVGFVFFEWSKGSHDEEAVKEKESIPEEMKPIPDYENATPQDINEVSDANNRFALELYSRMKEEGDNVFFSPWSISSALAMTYEGARGKTAEEMLSVLHFPADDRKRMSAFAGILAEINKGDKKYELRTANALWAQKDYHLLDSFSGIIQKYYGGKVTDLNFVDDPEGSRTTINDWVEDQTNEKIKDLIPSGTINQFTRLVLTNAIYFKGEWVKQFDKKNTQVREFRVSPSKTVEVPMMSSTGPEAKFNYIETENVQILELPYSGKELSMLVLLPKDENLEALEDSLTVEKLAEWRNSLVEEKVDVYVPKFKLETKYSLVDTFKRLGMRDAFDSGHADFSGITGKRDLFISDIIHQGYVEVNEEGTEAAAATGVIMVTSAQMPGKTFMADHPFLFIILERDTGNILFMGRIINPSGNV